ncbi:MAG TPA: formate--tetrahydrofolate ligase, partial [Spirochaetota bacterium]|nr:formate--tetrahydrofolate ligase [Spirochaetota bacterium]
GRERLPLRPGADGGIDLARKVSAIIDDAPAPDFRFLYETGMTIQEKISVLAGEIYGAAGVQYSKKALEN